MSLFKRRPPSSSPIFKFLHETLFSSLCSDTKSSPKSANPETYFISTPIYYVNGDPHLGHAYTSVLADCLHRRQRLKGLRQTRFSTGTDEHGLKVQQAAAANNSLPQVFCDEVSSSFRNSFDDLNIAYTHFVRTTDANHARAVDCFWSKLRDEGQIYKGSYEGWYSIVDEAYLPPNAAVRQCDATGRHLCPDSGNPVHWNQEENHLFRLTAFKEKLTKWLTTEEVIQPRIFLPSVLSSINEIEADLSVSRLRSRLPWGLPVPGDETQTIYVWLDALVNYLTVADYPDDHATKWPATHLIGKDILKFHAIYWPAFLMAAGLPLPPKILVHSHWLVDHRKMSKSLSNVVSPQSLIQKFSPDGLRYFLLSEGVPSQDGNFSEQKILEKLNAELCNTAGNLLNRVVGKNLNPDQTFPRPRKETFEDLTSKDVALKNLVDRMIALPQLVDAEFENFTIYRGCDLVMAAMREANAYLQHAKPWKLDKASDGDVIAAILFATMESLRVSGVLLQPVVPQIAALLLDTLAVPRGSDRSWEALFNRSKPFYAVDSSHLNTEFSHNILELKQPLYKRIYS